MKFVAPSFALDAFNCPYCGAYSHMTWSQLMRFGNRTEYYQSNCAKCEERTLWKTKTPSANESKADLIYPDTGTWPIPEDQMPEDVKTDYIEASRIFSRSPRGGAALLRLSLQKLCKHLGEPGENIYADIRSLAQKHIIPPNVIKAADTVRITGNNAVHPGEMSDEDFDYVASKMFDLINFIVKKGISEPKELEALYLRTPEQPRKSAEATDEKTKGTTLLNHD